MATNAKALKALYEALGGEEELVNPSNLDCLNAIAVLGGGEAQETNAAAINEIAENPPSGGGGSGDIVKRVQCTLNNTSSTKVEVDSYELDEAFGAIIRKSRQVLAGRTDNFYLLASGYADDQTSPHAEGRVYFYFTSAVADQRTLTATKGTFSDTAIQSDKKGMYATLSGDWDDGTVAITVANA